MSLIKILYRHEITIKNFGIDIMMSLGGSMHGHPSGTVSGAKAMRQAFDLLFQKSHQ